MTLDALCASSDVVDLIYDTLNAASTSFLFDSAAAFGVGVGVGGAPAVEAAPGEQEEKQGRRKRRRRTRSCKSKEEAECQRMTHIAVERNRRRQMNEYLAVLRSLMPETYARRGDQASIVGGAIDFVKELEQQVQSLEAHKRMLVKHQKATGDMMQMATSTTCIEQSTTTSNCSSSSVTEEAYDAPPFAQFFTYPQYVWRHSPQCSSAAPLQAGNRSVVADIEVSLTETHANLRIMLPRRPGQLLKMVAELQALRFTVLHLNVTTSDSLVLYSLNVKVEEGCSMTTVDDIATAVHHVLCIIDAETTSQQLLTGAQ